LTSELEAFLREDTDRRLREIINANVTTRFTSCSPTLVDFCLAIANKDMKDDATTLDDFYHLVPVTEYDLYCFLITKLME